MRSVGLGALLVAASLAVMATPAIAQSAQVARTTSESRGVEDTRAFVERIYARYNAAPNRPPEDPVYSYSNRLRALYAAYDAWQAQHQDLVGSVAFDWWTNSQDWGDLAIRQLREERRAANRRTIVVRFLNHDVESTNRFQFVRQGGRWYLDDVVNGSGRGDNGWTLSALLRDRPE